MVATRLQAIAWTALTKIYGVTWPQCICGEHLTVHIISGSSPYVSSTMLCDLCYCVCCCYRTGMCEYFTRPGIKYHITQCNLLLISIAQCACLYSLSILYQVHFYSIYWITDFNSKQSEVYISLYQCFMIWKWFWNILVHLRDVPRDVSRCIRWYWRLYYIVLRRIKSWWI